MSERWTVGQAVVDAMLLVAVAAMVAGNIGNLVVVGSLAEVGSLAVVGNLDVVG
jgi:hypothetical protein